MSSYKNKYLKYKKKYLELKGGLRIFNGIDETGESKFVDGNGKICTTCKPSDKDIDCLKEEEDENGKFYSKSNCDIYLGMKKLTSPTNTKLNNKQFKIDSRTSLKRLLESISKTKNFSCLTGLPFTLEMQENILRFLPINEVIERIKSCPPPSQRMRINLYKLYDSEVYYHQFPYKDSTQTWTLIENFVVKKISIYIPQDLTNFLAINDYRFINSVEYIQIVYPLFDLSNLLLKKFKNVETLEIGLIKQSLTEIDLAKFIDTFPKLKSLKLVYIEYKDLPNVSEVQLLDNNQLDYEILKFYDYTDWLGDYDYIDWNQYYDSEDEDFFYMDNYESESEEIDSTDESGNFTDDNNDDDIDDDDYFFGPDPNFQDGNY